MSVQNVLDFILINKSADNSSGGWVVSWITSWWKYNRVTVWWGLPLKILARDDWF